MRNQTLQEDQMELGTIERELVIDAAPEVVFDVVSNELELTPVVDSDWEVAKSGLELVALAEIGRPDEKVSAAAAP